METINQLTTVRHRLRRKIHRIIIQIKKCQSLTSNAHISFRLRNTGKRIRTYRCNQYPKQR